MNNNDDIFEKKETKNIPKPFKPYWNDGRIPTKRVELTDSNANHDYYGQFENYENGDYRSIQIWASKNDDGIEENSKWGSQGLFDEFKNTSFYGSMKEEAKKAHKITKETGNLRGFLSPPEYIPGDLVKDNNLSPDLAKENQELKQQLAEVQKQLAEVLTELKKLKNTGKDSAKLDQQIAHNEKLIENGEKVSEREVKEQVQKSQALLKETNISTSPTKDNQKDNSSSSLPYLIGGSVVVIGILASWLLMRKKAKN